MNPLTNAKNQQKLNQRELDLGLTNTATSWHAKYKDSAWVFVGGIPYELTEGDLICVFSQYGEIVNLNLVRDKDTGKSKGFCFVCYEDQRSTILAVDNLNAAKLLNRTIRVDHVENYKVPKEYADQDELTTRLQKEGCAPPALSVPAPSMPSQSPTAAFTAETVTAEYASDNLEVKEEKMETKEKQEEKKEKNNESKDKKKKEKKLKKLVSKLKFKPDKINVAVVASKTMGDTKIEFDTEFDKIKERRNAKGWDGERSTDHRRQESKDTLRVKEKDVARHTSARSVEGDPRQKERDLAGQISKERLSDKNGNGWKEEYSTISARSRTDTRTDRGTTRHMDRNTKEEEHDGNRSRGKEKAAERETARHMDERWQPERDGGIDTDSKRQSDRDSATQREKERKRHRDKSNCEGSGDEGSRDRRIKERQREKR